MVQRKVFNKPGIHAEHVKSEKPLGNLKPSLFQHLQEGKNRGGADLKKKMKKSRSLKRSDFESLRSPRHRKDVPQPGKPPPLLDVTPKKQSPAKAHDASPNYMKSTSSSAAKKEQQLPQVSTRASSQTASDRSSSRKNSANSNLSSGTSVHKASKTLARTSSLKRVRTLTKSPSFKPTRGSNKKRSHVVLCENLEVQRATCSSTLKDTKFPVYLPLNPGGTESDGTSAMKVCPYTYCSLNGHHHPVLPPLKCFVSGRRRMLKTQKSVKLGCLSPRSARPSKDQNDGLVVYDLYDSAINPMMQEEDVDFFIEIHTIENENGLPSIGSSEREGHDHGKMNLAAVDIAPSVVDNEETTAESFDGEVVETLEDESTSSEVDFENNLNQNNDIVSSEMDILGCFPCEDKEIDDAEEFYTENLVEEESVIEFFGKRDDFMVQTPPSIQQYESDSEGSDMDWEAGKFSATYLDDEFYCSTKFSCTSDTEKGSLEIDNHNLQGYPACQFDEIMDDEELQESFNSDEATWVVDICSKTNSSVQNLESGESVSTLSDAGFLPMNRDQETDQSCQEKQLPSSHAGDDLTNQHIDDAESSLNSLQDHEATQKQNTEDHHEDRLKTIAEDEKPDRSMASEMFLAETQHHSSDKESKNLISINCAKPNSVDLVEQAQSASLKAIPPAGSDDNIQRIEEAPADKTDSEEICSMAKRGFPIEIEDIFSHTETNFNHERSKDNKNLRWTTKSRRAVEESDKIRQFNPREPNYLPIEPDPEAERVDLRHQMIDERKNTEEWMLDYALRRAVNKLAPARQRKVALLVEAFETVIPVPKWERPLQHTSAAFTHTRPIQACS